MRFILPALLASFALASTARAETSAPWDSGCLSADAVVPGSLPANVGGIPIRGGFGVVSASLLAPDGTVVSDKLVTDSSGRFTVLVLDKELTPDATYTVRWSDGCDGMKTKSFLATAAVTLPAGAGMLTAGKTVENGYGGACDSFGRPILLAERLVHFAAAPELAPLMPVATGEVIVDGVPQNTSFDPSEYRPGISNPVGLACPNIPATHFVSIRVRFPNGTTLNSNELKVDLTCPDVPPFPCRADAPPAIDTEPSEKPSPQAAAPDESERAAQYGCGASGRGTAGVELAMIALALALGARGKR